MNKYYLVPITSKAISYDLYTLNEMLQNVNSELYERKELEMALKNDSSIAVLEREELKKITQAKFKSYGLPPSIIVVKDESSIYEIGTELPLIVDDAYLEVFRIDSSSVVDYFVDNDNYLTEVSKFFTEFLKKDKLFKKGKSIQ